jgi:hypothetical protein
VLVLLRHLETPVWAVVRLVLAELFPQVALVVVQVELALPLLMFTQRVLVVVEVLQLQTHLLYFLMVQLWAAGQAQVTTFQEKRVMGALPYFGQRGTKNEIRLD